MLNTPASKRYANLAGLSPPLKMKRSSLGATKRSNVTLRTKPPAVLQGESNFAQTVLNQMEKMSTLEQKAPILENATVGDFMIFKPLFEAYKAQNGSRNLAQLLSVPTKNVLCVIYDKQLTDFNLVDDSQLMTLLEHHFQVLDTNDYRSKLQAVYMDPNKFKYVEIDQTQLYVQKFLNILVNNPSYKDPQMGGGTPKQINILFIAGFQPPGFKSLVQDFGTESIYETVQKLNILYTDIRTTLRINRRLGPLLLATAPPKDTNHLQKDSSPQSPPSQNRCTPTHCCGRSTKGRLHSADNCFIMHPELRNLYTPPKPTSAPVQKKGMLAVGDTTSTMDSKIDGLCAAMQQLKQDLEETKKVILARRQRLHTDNIPPDKPHYLDSGNNYSVISTLHHIDTDTSYLPSPRHETLETAS